MDLDEHLLSFLESFQKIFVQCIFIHLNFLDKLNFGVLARMGEWTLNLKWKTAVLCCWAEAVQRRVVRRNAASLCKEERTWRHLIWQVIKKHTIYGHPLSLETLHVKWRSYSVVRHFAVAESLSSSKKYFEFVTFWRVCARAFALEKPLFCGPKKKYD